MPTVMCDSLIILKRDSTHTCTRQYVLDQRSLATSSYISYNHLLLLKESMKCKYARIDPRVGVAQRHCICLPKCSKKGTEKSIKTIDKIDG